MALGYCDFDHSRAEDKVTKEAERFITAYCMAKEDDCRTCPLNRKGKSYNANAKFIVKDGDLAIIDGKTGEKLW